MSKLDQTGAVELATRIAMDRFRKNRAVELDPAATITSRAREAEMELKRRGLTPDRIAALTLELGPEAARRVRGLTEALGEALDGHSKPGRSSSNYVSLSGSFD